MAAPLPPVFRFDAHGDLVVPEGSTVLSTAPKRFMLNQRRDGVAFDDELKRPATALRDDYVYWVELGEGKATMCWCVPSTPGGADAFVVRQIPRNLLTKFHDPKTARDRKLDAEGHVPRDPSTGVPMFDYRSTFGSGPGAGRARPTPSGGTSTKAARTSSSAGAPRRAAAARSAVDLVSEEHRRDTSSVTNVFDNPDHAKLPAMDLINAFARGPFLGPVQLERTFNAPGISLFDAAASAAPVERAPAWAPTASPIPSALLTDVLTNPGDSAAAAAVRATLQLRAAVKAAACSTPNAKLLIGALFCFTGTSVVPAELRGDFAPNPADPSKMSLSIYSVNEDAKTVFCVPSTMDCATGQVYPNEGAELLRYTVRHAPGHKMCASSPVPSEKKTLLELAGGDEAAAATMRALCAYFFERA